MSWPAKTQQYPFTALLICPNRALAAQFLETAARDGFQVLSQLENYPSRQTLDIRLRQIRPDLVVLDVGSNLSTAADLIRYAVATSHHTHVVAIHSASEPELVLRALRSGATEFLTAPFEIQVQQEALARLRRLRQPQTDNRPEPGHVLAFASAKPGSGASTLAAQLAFSLQALTKERVLLADFDVMGGTIGFCLKIAPEYSLSDLLTTGDSTPATHWQGVVATHAGLDLLPSPAVPPDEPPDTSRLHEIIESARSAYDWVLIDLPAIFHRISLITFSQSDQAFLVSSAELPSLHLARKAAMLLAQLGIEKQRFQLVLNRATTRHGIRGAELEKILSCPVSTTLPDDYLSTHRALALGQPLERESALGRAVEGLAAQICGSIRTERKGAASGMEPALSQT